MELCKENLMGRIFQNRDNIHSLSLTPGAARSVIRWARDIANALEFIHSQGIVHGDFKLENIVVSAKNGTRIISYFRVAYDKKTAQTFTNSAITFILHLTRTTAGLAEKRNTCSFLVGLKSLLLLSFVMCIISQLSHEDDVRIANVSVSRGAKMTTGTMKETFYIAPEVIKSGFYNSKADIYSFGIMLWEMWYRKRALTDVEGDVRAVYGEDAERNRPTQVDQDRKKPPPTLQDLMQGCLDEEADKRPDATACRQRLTMLYQDTFPPI